MGHSPHVGSLGGEGPKHNSDQLGIRHGLSSLSQCTGRAWPLRNSQPLCEYQLDAACAEMPSHEDFIEYVADCSSPLQEPPATLPCHVAQAVRMRAALKDKTRAWRMSQMESLKKVARAFPAGDGLCWELMSYLLGKSQSAEKHLQADKLVGIIPASGRWEPLPLPTEVAYNT